MCDELVKRLRDYSAARKGEIAELTAEAADAIEELKKAVNFHKYNSEFWEDKYNTLADEEEWISVEDHLPEEFVSVQAHMTDAGPFPSVREGYLAGGKWYFPALNEYHPADKWAEFSEPPKEET